MQAGFCRRGGDTAFRLGCCIQRGCYVQARDPNTSSDLHMRNNVLCRAGERAVHCNAQSALEAILHLLFLFPWEEGDSVLDTSTAGSMNSSSRAPGASKTLTADPSVFRSSESRDSWHLRSREASEKGTALRPAVEAVRPTGTLVFLHETLVFP